MTKFEIRDLLIENKKSPSTVGELAALDCYIDLCFSGECIERPHKHHILPKGKTWFPQYSNLDVYTWNAAYISAYDHVMAHYYLAKFDSKYTGGLRAILAFSSVNEIYGLTEDEVETMAMAKQYAHDNNTGENNPFFGMNHTHEAKNKMSERKKGEIWNYEDILFSIFKSNRKKSGRTMGLTTFRKLVVGMGYPDVHYGRMIEYFNTKLKEDGKKKDIKSELFEIFKTNSTLGYRSFRKLVVGMGYPDVDYYRMVKMFKENYNK